MTKRDPKRDPWQESYRPGYCYHAAVLRWKTETLLRKWSEPDCTPRKRLQYAHELSFRDPALALAEVTTWLSAKDIDKLNKTERLCLHHVADAATARKLLASKNFDPDALHLSAFAALIDDFIEALPRLDADSAEKRLRALGFLAGPVPSPMRDGPWESELNRSSSARYEQLVVRMLSAAFESEALRHVREELAEHLRRTCNDQAYELLLDRWMHGDISAVEVIAAVARLGVQRAEACLGDRFDDLLDAFVYELAAPPRRFESSALSNGFIPPAKDFPLDAQKAILRALLAQPRFVELHEYAVTALFELHAENPVVMLAYAKILPDELFKSVTNALPYDEAVRRLAGAGVTHWALSGHPGAPPDLTLVPRSDELIDIKPNEACELLAGVARDKRHPQRDVALDRLLALAARPDNSMQRRYAIFELGRVGDRRAEQVLRAASVDPRLLDAHHLVGSALSGIGVEPS